MNKYPNLFSKIKVGNVMLKNRVVAGPASTRFTEGNGYINKHYIQYVAQRARGGAGLIISEATSPDSAFAHPVSPVCLNTFEHQVRYQDLADAVHVFGTKMIIQLEAGGADYTLDPIEQGIETCNKWTHEEIKEMQDHFVRAAEYVKAAGLDGVEISATGGYVIHQFLTLLTNYREDEYGVTIEGRARMMTESVKAVREAVGPNFIIGVRLPGMDIVPDNDRCMTLEECGEIAKLCEEAGADLINMGVGISYDDEYFETEYRPDGDRVDWSAVMKKYVSIPVIANGKIKTAAFADEVIKEGKADMVSSARQFLADPNWPNKSRIGKEDEVRPCLSCNECICKSILVDGTLRCSVNPYLGVEYYIDENCIPPAGCQKKVVVVGAGPAGITAATTAAQRGHKVTLIEKAGKLNGQMRLAGKPTHKENVAKYCAYMEKQLDKCGVDVLLGTEATVELVKSFNPDAVIVTCGAVPIVPPIPGKDLTVQSWDYLDNDCQGIENKTVAVIGGGQVGLETAVTLAEKGGCKVTVLEMKDYIGEGSELYHSAIMPRELEKFGIEAITSAVVCNITEDSVTYKNADGEKVTIPAEVTVMAAGRKAVGNDLREALLDEGIPVMGGDAEYLKIKDATRAGLILGYQI